MNSRISTIVLFLFVLLANSCKNEISTKIESESVEINLVKVKGLLQEMDDQFGESFSNGDSVAIAEHYAKEGKVKALDTIRFSVNTRLDNSIT